MWKAIENNDYHNSMRSYLSSSDVRNILRSPAHYRYAEPPQSEALKLGSLVHAIVLEPAIAEKSYRTRADVDGRTKEGRAIRENENMLAITEGVEFVSRKDWDTAQAIAASVHTHLGAQHLLNDGVAEVAGFCDEFQGIKARIKPDYRTSEFIVDLKTTQDARPDSFLRSIMTFGYCVQAAYYLDVAQAIDGETRKFFWIAVEKEPPYAVAVYEASDAMIRYGRAQYLRAIELYKECSALDIWPSYSQQIQQLTLPHWVNE